MNKDLLNQLPADEQPIASQLTSVAENMQLSPSVQWELENQLMDTAKKKTHPQKGWSTKIVTSTAWATLAICAVFLLNWAVRSIASNPPAATEVVFGPAPSFETDVRQSRICTKSLALAHDFSVLLTTQEKDGFIKLDSENRVPAFAWSPDGQQLALTGGVAGGDIYLTDASGKTPEFLINPGAGYLMDIAWSHDGKQLLTWSVGDNSVVYLMNADGTDMTRKALGKRGQLFAAPQFAPDDKSIVFFGAESSAGLFQMTLRNSQLRMISDLAQGDHSFAWSPDGSRLAYIEIDRDLGEVRLITEETASGRKAVITSLPIPQGTFPNSADLSWTPDGKSLVFEFRRDVPDPDNAIYLAHADGSGLVELVRAAHAPAISADGKCLAYISNNQVFLMDLTDTSSPSMLIGDLPAGVQTGSGESDKLQWQP